MKAPSYNPPPVDPLAAAAGQRAQQEDINAMQQQSEGDTASLMARYGALASLNGPAPTSASSPAVGALAGARG